MPRRIRHHIKTIENLAVYGVIALFLVFYTAAMSDAFARAGNVLTTAAATIGTDMVTERRSDGLERILNNDEALVNGGIMVSALE